MLGDVLANTDIREWRPLFYATGIDNAVMAMPSTDFVDDKPSFRAAVSGADRVNWFAAMDREHANLTNHNAYTEVPEDSLSTWDHVKRRAYEVIKTLWVLIRKRDGDANLIEGDAAYKGRCVVDGANKM